MNLFGKKKNSISANPESAIAKLQETLNMLEKKETFLETQISGLKKQAVLKLKAKQKQQALYCLRKSKILEKQYDRVLGTKLSLETQVFALTQAITNTQTVSALKMGLDALTAEEKKVDVDSTTEVVENLEEKLAGVEEMADVMARPLGQHVDDDELMQELMNLELEAEPAPRVKTPDLVLPSVPVDVPDEEESEELKELQKTMLA